MEILIEGCCENNEIIRRGALVKIRYGNHRPLSSVREVTSAGRPRDDGMHGVTSSLTRRRPPSPSWFIRLRTWAVDKAIVGESADGCLRAINRI